VTERISPPSGHSPPDEALLAGQTLDLLGLAGEICQRYAREFPDERSRYGQPGREWCVHDNQHILNWGVLAVEWDHDLEADLAWLASVLAHRDFPLSRLVRDLEIAADVIGERLGPAGDALAARLRSGAQFVRGLPERSPTGEVHPS